MRRRPLVSSRRSKSVLVVVIAILPLFAALSRGIDTSYAAELVAQPTETASEDCPKSDVPPRPGWTTQDPLPPWAAQMPAPRDTGVTKTVAEVKSDNEDQIFVRVYLPDAYPRPLPTVLHLWPFSTSNGVDVSGLCDFEPAAVFLLRRGYAVVIADDPGTGNSTGCFDFGGPAEQRAGKAVVDWIAEQPWSNGRVGMRGFSAAGLSQVATAAARPTALKAIIAGSPTPPYGIFHPGATTTELRAIIAFFLGLQAAPATNLDGSAETLFEAACPEDYVKWNDSDGTLDVYWRQRHLPLLAAQSTAAVLTTVGSPFGDGVRIGWDPMWKALEEHSVPRKAVVGPWGHDWPTIDNWPLHELRWLEHWLRGNDTGIMSEPPLTLVDQANVKRLASTFPVRTVSLHAFAGHLGGPPKKGTATYSDIPGAPQSVLRAEGGSLDYASDPLATAIRLSGAGHVLLAAAADTTDTDFAAIVYDRAPDGTSRAVTWGYLDARHRKALDQPGIDVVPGAVTDYRVRLAGTEWTVAAGHRLELYLASSDGCTPATALVGPGPFSPACSEIGLLRSDGSRAKVTVHEGPGSTRVEFLSFPT